MKLKTNQIFNRTDAIKQDRGTAPGVAQVESVTVYTNAPTKNEPVYYWLLPKTLCVMVDGVSIYITLKEKK